MKKIKSLDNINALDLTAIAYAVAVLVGVCSRMDLTITMLITSIICTMLCVKTRKIALSILNASLLVYVCGELWSHHIVELIEQGVDTMQDFFKQFTFNNILFNLFKR